uniref:Serine-threonine/tyrosine-protein kinase catalytic domain-containing protein n=1 Tax=Daucus carota subsp. sativus TaxID=79200 RepID=A0A164WD42_DAUCS
MPKLRPLMSTVVKMLTGEIEVQGKLIAKPGILPEAFLRRNIITGDASSPGYSSIEASPMPSTWLLNIASDILAWELYQEQDIVGLVDASLNGKFSLNEASRYIKIAFLCTQAAPRSRPLMSDVVNMLKGDIDVSEMEISKPGLLSELSRTYKSTPYESSIGSGKPDDVFLSMNEMSCGTMTFTSIEDGRD